MSSSRMLYCGTARHTTRHMLSRAGLGWAGRCGHSTSHCLEREERVEIVQEDVVVQTHWGV